MPAITLSKPLEAQNGNLQDNQGTILKRLLAKAAKRDRRGTPQY